jgi:two-component system cell cycle response regulator
LKTDSLDGLSAFGSAITAAERLLRARPHEAEATIRRIARVMQGAGYVQEIPDLLTTCQAVLDAPASELSKWVAALKSIVDRHCSTLPSERVVILIVDDDPVMAQLLSLRLRSPTREILVAGNAAQALEIVAHRLISLVLLDLGLPDRDGRDVLAEIRLKTASLAIPIFILSSTEDAHVKMECYALGADAYFDKPVNIDLLLTVVAAKLQRIAEIGRKLRHDPLTGALNRLSFTELFEHYAALAARTKGDLAIALLDLDRFKTVNDTYGHAMGDEVLRSTAAVLEHSLRKSDSFGRWGGEEFVVLLPGTDLIGASKALQTVLESLRQVQFGGFERKFNVSFSAGVAQVAAGAALEEAAAIADAKLYAAKAQGRNCIVT